MNKILHRNRRGVVEQTPDGIRFRRAGVSWRSHFDRLVREHYGHKREGAGRATSYRTREYTLETTFILMNVLRDELGFKLVKPANLDLRHVEAWAGWINQQYRDGHRQPATLAGYATTVRHLCRWAGQHRLVEIFDEHLDAKATGRELVADRDKTWDGNQVEFEEAFERVWAVEPWVAMALLAQAAFGLRRREAVQLHPLRDIELKAGALHVRVGAKGGRPRIVPIDTPQREQAARGLIVFVEQRNLRTVRDPSQSLSLGDPQLSLLQAIKRYANVLGTLGYTRADSGVTGHGLRAQYVCDRLQALGIVPVVKGGSGRHADPREDQIAHTLVTEAVGHSRRSIVGAYSSSPHAIERVQAVQTLRQRGWLLPGTDAASVQENLRRREAFIADPEAFAAWVTSDAAARTHSPGEDLAA